MPELPEVEIAARTVRRSLVGQVIERTRTFDPRIVRHQSARALARAVTGREVLGVRRLGKHLLLDLEGDGALWLHLGMTGKLVHRAPGERGPSHVRLAFSTSNGRLLFRDPRLFGGATAGSEAEVRRRVGWDRLGPDALSIGASGRALRDALGTGPRPIKIALMDQHRLAGIGNIQAAEALFRARIHPSTRAGALAPRDWGRLARGLAGTLAHTLAVSGDEEITYVTEERDHNPFQVYGRQGEACPRCSATIDRVLLGGRSTFFCPACQAAISEKEVS